MFNSWESANKSIAADGSSQWVVYHRDLVMGPLLFVILINDLDGKASKFADGSKIGGRVVN